VPHALLGCTPGTRNVTADCDKDHDAESFIMRMVSAASFSGLAIG
jgi:hypothetical protein